MAICNLNGWGFWCHLITVISHVQKQLYIANCFFFSACNSNCFTLHSYTSRYLLIATNEVSHITSALQSRWIEVCNSFIHWTAFPYSFMEMQEPKTQRLGLKTGKHPRWMAILSCHGIYFYIRSKLIFIHILHVSLTGQNAHSI